MISRTVTLYSSTGVTASADGATITLPRAPLAIIGRLTATLSSGSGTLSAKIQHSPTGDTNTWKDLVSFSATTASTIEDVHNLLTNMAIWPCVRATFTISGGTWDIKIDIGIE